MLLNIDKVLRMLAEGKDVKKISENSDLSEKEISDMIEEARKLLNKFAGNKVRKKIIIRKNKTNKTTDVEDEFKDIFEGAELNAIPLETNLIFNIAVASAEQFYKTGVIILTDDENQVAKLHFKIEETEERPSVVKALEKCLKIADYFKASAARFKIDEKFVFQILSEGIKTDDKYLAELIEDYLNKMKSYDHYRVEFINKFANEKANYVASQRIKSKRPKE